MNWKSFSKFVLIAISLVSILLVTGCGNKGALTLPVEKTDQAKN
ncbi:MAG: lipoprotein [Gammaproteobacteria bacterium]|nr:lipoprotein [Gammaproteobacteria bacterium]MBT3722708.1 lipoprotein [Gammaproteobacteria bacterium]MBT4076987.1 lipoprotein [Gammaproteobacteria bacterium]MBT4195050.1 lipoprotein [Gammaproteobacteria bacterium]MBT4452255.1 lipoprotein [Gammaproteobacteria bacterium]